MYFSDPRIRFLQFVRADRKRRLALFGKLEECLQSRNALAVCLGKVDHCRGHGGKHHHFLPRAGNGDVEPAPSAHLVERPEVEGNAARTVGPVAHGEQDHVALVALNVFQVLDKERFLSLVCDVFQLVFDKRVRKLSLDEILLRRTECDDTDARTGKFGIFQAADDLFTSASASALLRLVKPRS